MRWIIGTLAFCAPILFVLTAAAQTPQTVLTMIDQVAAVTMH